ncbi:MAG: ABC transporter ATP-binding protein [Anaerolineaceae bacterium]|nr:ABC transporter ATP-binding protein [Anaerolineaceae bacterium]
MTSSPEAALSVKNLGVTFSDASGVVHALHDLSFSLAPNEFVSLIGPSGSGKSTLLRVLAGLIPPTHGDFDVHQRQPKVGLVFQQANLMPWRRVIENVGLPLELQGIPSDQIKSRAQELIELVGLEGFEQAYPRDLSGGMAQRVAIARSLMQDPDLLLLDEPFGSLDDLTRERMGDELLHIWQASRKTVLMVTHSISEAIYLSDRVLVLSPRPGMIKLDLTIDLPRPRTPNLRVASEFSALAQTLRESLRDEEPI